MSNTKAGPRAILATLVSMMLAPATALAQDADADASPADWQFQITPYVWASGFSGRLRPLAIGPDINFDQSFSDILANLDVALFLAGSARKGPLVFAGDLAFARVSDSGTVPPGVRARGELQTKALTLLAGYSVVQTPEATVDLMMGLRATSLKSEAEIPVVGLQISPSKEFVDPLLAVRGTFAIAPRWSASLYADIGGFGVGSDQTWQVVAVGSYAIRDDMFVSAGWRHLHLDYRDAGSIFEVDQKGPLVGLTWRF